MNSGEIAGIIIASIFFVFIVLFFVFLPKKAYFSALFSGAYVCAFTLIGMKSRKVNIKDIVSAYILAKKTGLGIKLFELEEISASGGNARKVVEGINAAKLAKIDIDLEFAKAVDIAGIDILQVVRDCVQPKVIELPLVTAVAKDNCEVIVKISLSLKVDLKEFLTGVTDETVAARGIEATVTKIANTDKAATLVAHPEYLDKAIFDAEIDDNSKYELVSADVIHIDFGKNRGLDIENDRMEKDHRLQIQKLEQRKMEAVAVEQEMKARAEEMRAKTVANEAEVPKALIKAIEEGKINDLTDYYKLQNLMADTQIKMKSLKTEGEE